MNTQALPVVAITGATATGKTAVATALADLLPVSLISVDSAMVYRGLDIGTAKPTPAELAAHPHALVDIRDPADIYTAADFVRDADQVVRQARADRRLPVLVGGTMMYLKAYRDGLADLPVANPELRAQLAARAETEGWQALHDELATVDAVVAQAIDPRNTQRLTRALEVFLLTGKPISRFWQEQQRSTLLARTGESLLEFALDLPRAELHQRIYQRLYGMLEAGFLGEVASLRTRSDLHLELPAMRSVGYRQAWQHLAGDLNREEFEQATLAATRQLARRQYTWLRRWTQVTMLPANDRQLALKRIVGALEMGHG